MENEGTGEAQRDTERKWKRRKENRKYLQITAEKQFLPAFVTLED